MAQAIGLRLYDQKRRKLLADQLAAVKILTEAPVFPAKVKGKGWPRAEVLAWVSANLKLAKDKRAFDIVPAASRKDAKTQSELPPAVKTAGDGDLFITLTPEQKHERRLDLLEDKFFFPEKHLESKIAKFEIDELRQYRPHLFAKSGESPAGGAESSLIYGGLEGVATAINKEFAGANCHRAYVSDWIKGKRAPCDRAGVPPMPGSPEGNGRYDRAAIFKWYRQYVLVETTEQGLPMRGGMDARSRKEMADAEMAELELDGLKKSVSEKYMETVTVLGFVGGFAHWLGLQQDKFIEDRAGVRKLVAECVTAMFKPSVEQLAALDVQLAAQLAAANSAMKTATAHRVTELVNDLTEKRKEEVQANKQS